MKAENSIGHSAIGNRFSTKILVGMPQLVSNEKTRKTMNPRTYEVLAATLNAVAEFG